MTSSNVTFPGNMNIHVNPSQQFSEMYGSYVPQDGSPSPGYNQGFNQPSSTGFQDFNQSGKRAQDFNQSGNSPRKLNEPNRPADSQHAGGNSSNQGDPRTFHRVLSCPNCSLLCTESQTRCLGCNFILASGKTSGGHQKEQPFNSNTNMTSGYSKQQMLLKDVAKSNELATRTLPDIPHEQAIPPHGQAVSPCDDNNSYYEEVDDLLEWNCEHCTFANPTSTKVCQLCFKTPSDLTKFPKLVEVM